jgi:hypothetical protein
VAAALAVARAAVDLAVARAAVDLAVARAAAALAVARADTARCNSSQPMPCTVPLNPMHIQKEQSMHAAKQVIPFLIVTTEKIKLNIILGGKRNETKFVQ